MNLTPENILFVGAVLLLLSVMLGKTSFRYGVPALLLFLGLGMLAGSEGLWGIEFENAEMAQFIGLVALNFILFSGGLETNWKSIRPVLWQGISLSTVGVLITAVGVGAFVYYLTDFTIYESLLLGAVVSSTDAAAVFSILRSKNLGLKENIRPVLELESGSNDPMAYVLTVSMLGLVLEPEKGLASVLPVFFTQMFVGAAAGLLFGKLSHLLINRLRIDMEGLYPVMAMSLMFITFETTQYAGGNGFLAIYMCGVYLGNHNLLFKKAIIQSFDGYAWLMQIVLFLTLGLLVFPSQVVPFMGLGLLLSLFMIFVARPFAVFVSLMPFRMSMKRRAFISWVGLRGAVPIVFATYPLVAGVDKADIIFNTVFFISITSVLIQGTTLSLLARYLGLELPAASKPVTDVDAMLQQHPKSVLREVRVPAGTYFVGRRIVDLGIPDTATVAMVKRGEQFISPSRATTVEADDLLIILSNVDDAIDELPNLDKLS